MSIPGRLYDASLSPEVLISAGTITISRRAIHAPAFSKSNSWPLRLPGGAIDLRVTIEGITDTVWISALMARQGGSASGYRVALDDGDAHVGNFVVEEVSERT